jgi:predicted nucleic acid-binding protein
VTETAVVDTDVVSYLFKGHTRAWAYDEYLIHESLVISFMTLGEIEYGMFADRWGESGVAQWRTIWNVVSPYSIPTRNVSEYGAVSFSSANQKEEALVLPMGGLLRLR